MLSQKTASSSAVAGDNITQQISGDGEPKRDRRPTMISEGNRLPMKAKKKKKEFPPPIPSLVQTDQDPPEHMPSVMKRYYTHDGRLILREETMRHHEYIRSHRSNGRLTLQLVALNEVVQEQTEEEEGERIECSEQGCGCYAVSSRPSIKCLDSCHLGIEVGVPEMIPPVHTL